jgi:cysteine-rich repeat protein
MDSRNVGEPNPTDITGVDPLLGPLADNGGRTRTHALLPGSPAINAGHPGTPANGDAICPTTDQRGVVRPVGPACDIGAFELEYAAGCGNGVLEPGEACDDGNLLDGDCCSSSCQAETPGATCASDGNSCTDDVCDTRGRCTHVANDAPCSDGDPCTSGDRCSAGTCIPGAPCDPCLACDPSAGCVVPPTPCDRAEARDATLILETGGLPERHRLTWRWRGVGGSDFGMPDSSTPYLFCLYDATMSTFATRAPAGGQCGGHACWSRRRRGWNYLSPDFTPDGIARLVLRSGSGKTRVLLRGRGANLRLGTSPLASPVLARLYRSDTGACWEAAHPSPLRERRSRISVH